MPVVLIVSSEWDLRGAVRAELREAGIEALGLETVDEMGRMIARGVAPSLIVVDGVQEIVSRVLEMLSASPS